MPMKLLRMTVVGLLLAASAPPVLAAPDNPLPGAWHVVSVHWRSADDTQSIESAQPGLFIFTDDHYSLMWVPINEPRTAFKELSKPTADEMQAGFRSVVFNAGHYQQTDSGIVSTAIIAKVPGFEGGKQYFRFRLDGERMLLTMFDETYPDGSKPDWAGRWETEFVLQRERATE